MREFGCCDVELRSRSVFFANHALTYAHATDEDRVRKGQDHGNECVALEGSSNPLVAEQQVFSAVEANAKVPPFSADIVTVFLPAQTHTEGALQGDSWCKRSWASQGLVKSKTCAFYGHHWVEERCRAKTPHLGAIAAMLSHKVFSSLGRRSLQMTRYRAVVVFDPRCYTRMM